MRLVITAAILLLLLPAASAVINTTGNITLTNNNGDITADVNPAGSGISVTFLPGFTGGGGGGGGGVGDGGEPNPCLLPPIKTSHSYDYLEAGREYKLQAPNNQFTIQKLVFSLAKSYEDSVTFILTHVRKIECETIPPVPSDRMALDYERVDYVGIDPEQVHPGVRITFKLSTARLEEIGGNKENITLYRYDGNNWGDLPTSVSNETSSVITFQSTSPGLSHFAITLPAPRDEVVQDSGQPATPITGKVVDGNTSGGTETGDGETGETGGATTTGRSGGGSIPFWSIIVIILIGGALGAYYYYDNKKKVAAINKKAEERKGKEDEPEIGFAEIGDKAFSGVQDPVEQLHDYVDEELREGFSRDEIAAELKKSGWPDDVITKVLDQFRKSYLEKRGMHKPHDDYEHVSAFLKEKLDFGYDVAVIKKNLVAQGWNEQLITNLLNDIQGKTAPVRYSAAAMAKLRGFIEAERKKGFTNPQIRDALVKTGWHADVVDQEVR